MTIIPHKCRAGESNSELNQRCAKMSSDPNRKPPKRIDHVWQYNFSDKSITKICLKTPCDCRKTS